MKRNKKRTEHPEVEEIKNICDVSPKTKITQGVCDKIQSDHQSHKKPFEKK